MRRSRKMTHEELITWVQTTFKELCFMLDLLDIPYNVAANGLYIDYCNYIPVDRLDDPKEFCPQITFPWHHADIVVGLRDYPNNGVRNGDSNILDFPYPSIESYGFRLGDGVEAYCSPVEAVKKIADLYEMIKED